MPKDNANISNKLQAIFILSDLSGKWFLNLKRKWPRYSNFSAVMQSHVPKSHESLINALLKGHVALLYSQDSHQERTPKTYEY